MRVRGTQAGRENGRTHFPMAKRNLDVLRHNRGEAAQWINGECLLLAVLIAVDGRPGLAST